MRAPVEHLQHIGHSKVPGEAAKFVEGNETKLVGEVTHRRTGEVATEVDLSRRENLRRRSIRALCVRIHKLYGT